MLHVRVAGEGRRLVDLAARAVPLQEAPDQVLHSHDAAEQLACPRPARVIPEREQWCVSEACCAGIRNERVAPLIGQTGGSTRAEHTSPHAWNGNANGRFMARKGGMHTERDAFMHERLCLKKKEVTDSERADTYRKQ